MNYPYFSRNGKILPNSKAVIPISNLEYSYGFGVYETIRVSKGEPLFLDQHAKRLSESARIIELKHDFSASFITKAVAELIEANEMKDGSLKLLLIGGDSKDSASLFVLSLSPLYPDRKLYSQGVHVITANYEREFPHAKTLNMLPSYLLFKKAMKEKAYDALLINREGCITEGTRTNFLALKGRTIISPPSDEILLGVTRDKVIKVAKQNGFKVTEKPIKLDEVSDYDNVFLTGTTCKILPIHSVDKYVWSNISLELKELMQAFNQFLAQ